MARFCIEMLAVLTLSVATAWGSMMGGAPAAVVLDFSTIGSPRVGYHDCECDGEGVRSDAGEVGLAGDHASHLVVRALGHVS